MLSVKSVRRLVFGGRCFVPNRESSSKLELLSFLQNASVAVPPKLKLDMLKV